MRDNLLYGVQHVPLREASYDEEGRRAHDQWLAEATASGNSTDDPNANWIDYAATGTGDDEELLKRIFDVLQIVGLDDDIYTLGLRGNIDPASQADLTNQFLKARAEFQDRLTDPDIAALVEGFDPGKYNENATLGENLLFGTPVGDAFDMDNLAQNRVRNLGARKSGFDRRSSRCRSADRVDNDRTVRRSAGRPPVL